MSDLLENLIQSKVKRKLLKLFLFNKNKKYHVRELSRLIEEPISAVQRELKKLIKMQIIVKYPEGNAINYFVNTQNPFYEDLRVLVLKTTTEPKDYFKILVNSKSLNIVALFGETVKSPMKFSEPINIMAVGSLQEDVLHEYLKAIMDIFSREYKLVYCTMDNFEELSVNDKRIKQILGSKNVLYLKNI